MTATLAFPDISGVRLSQDSAILRDFPLAAGKRTAKYEAAFDRHTLIYDAFRLGESKIVRLLCPRLLNLRDDLRAGLGVGGKAARIRQHRRSLRYEVIDVVCPQGKALTLDMADQHFEVAVHESTSPLFLGQNVGFHMSKDTPPDWIVDWARYHVSAHGMEGYLLFDNGTTAFDMAALGARLRDETGLKSVAIVSCPFPYGDKAGGKFVVPSKFLQVSMMQLARWRFFARAKGVLAVDIDEMVAPVSGSNIYEAAAASRFGLAKLEGHWAYPAVAQTAQPQAAHSRTVAGEKPCPPKWCLTRGALADRFEWSVHRPSGPLFPFAQVSGQFWHCRANTTGWKAARSAIPEAAKEDAKLVAAFQSHLKASS
ncbi:hypothetical protein AQS8620_03074 [Aquimixticola soesokkakensis]|uniref:Glycosyltransferase family 92 protein n=1 Tax=Aquimixticola soesokkakensis TaxID=1519096 RepID=A0A1Y5TKL1_9RHOB|nr:hypothetical protein [Aquimixticola soesokkakensis]SLN66186.1 hypothetical protein AQS8620_03074 [Aquimixticola soesokkakensis]